ncbi:hypothetical protein PENSPDRAFT_564141, partial [Peniophora sp. CONT]
AKLAAFWHRHWYIIIDKCSMLSKTHLAQLFQNIMIALTEEGGSPVNWFFGGLSIIILGDFHQFPPVAQSPHKALYVPSAPLDTAEMKIVRRIYEEFTTVVILCEQMRVTDPVWREFLQCLRYGVVKDTDIAMLQKLIISEPECTLPDSSREPWKDFGLVTPRHIVRKAWNESVLRQHCEETSTSTSAARELMLAERHGVALREAGCGYMPRKRKKKPERNALPDVLELAVSMKVMVTTNVETDFDITNGARGTLVDIVLNPKEP